MESGLFAISDLVTHVFGLEELGRAYQALDLRPDGFTKAVIRVDH